MKKVILCAALTGSMTSTKKNKNIPTTIEQIIDSAYECWKAGVTMVHIHVRDEMENPSLDYDLYKKVVEGIRRKCDVLICISTSDFGVKTTDEERLKLLDLDIDAASLAFGSLIRPNGSISNSPEYIKLALEKMYERNIQPEIEIFNEEMFERLISYYDEGILIKKPYVQFVFGSPGGMGSSYEEIISIIQRAPDWSNWAVAAVSKMQLPANLLTLTNDGDVVRTGLEDNLYYLKGQLADSNTQLVNRLVSIAPSLGRDIATPTEGKMILNM